MAKPFTFNLTDESERAKEWLMDNAPHGVATDKCNDALIREAKKRGMDKKQGGPQ